MNTVIVNNKPRPVVPSPLVVGRTQSVFNVFGYSLWNNDVLDKEIAQAQERHAKEIEKYKEKRQAWDELTAMEYHVLLDTNAVIESAKLSDGTVIDFEYIIETCTRFGFKLAVTKTAACEIKHQTKKKIGENFTKEKHAAAVKAVNMIVSGEILSVGFDRSRFSEEGFNSLDCYKNETIAEMRKRGFNCYAKALETINAEKFEFRFYGFLNDALIEDEAVAFAKRGNNVVFISNDGQVGGRGEMFFCEENKKFTSPCLREYGIFVNSINNKRSKIV